MRPRHPTIETAECYSIDAANPRLRAAFARMSGSISCQRWTYAAGFLLEIVIDASGSRPVVRLVHPTRDGHSGTEAYAVELTATAPTFGGRRWWFRCPATGERVRKLYLPRGGRRFLARSTYGLLHDSRGEGRMDRAGRRVRKLERRLGPDGSRPRWMKGGAYARLFARWVKATGTLERFLDGRG